MKRVTAILAADIHIRDTAPECRVDDFMEAQTKKLVFLRELQEEYDVPVLVAGDIFHRWKPSPFLLGYALRNVYNWICIPGQHDLPAHSLENIDKSGINVLAEARNVRLLEPKRELISKALVHMGVSIQGFPWGVDLKGTSTKGGITKVALVHKLVYKGKEPFPGAEKHGGTAKQIIKQMPGFDLLVTGDNHETFTERVGNTLLVNPGSFMRSTAAQVDHRPCVFLWDAVSNEVEPVYLPIDKKAVSRQHIEKRADKDERIEAFISRLSHDCEMSLSFEANLRTFLANNRVSKSVQNIIWNSVEGEK